MPKYDTYENDKRCQPARVMFDGSSLSFTVEHVPDPVGDERSWPRRPPYGYRLSDAQWAQLAATYKMPELTQDAVNVRALLEHTLDHAIDAIFSELRSAPIREKRNQLGRLSRSRIDRPIDGLLDRGVISLLAGVATIDPRHGNGDLSRHAHYIAEIRGMRSNTSDLREWARLCLTLDPAVRSHTGTHGGGHVFSEQQFIEVLLRIWAGVLKKPIQTWVGEKNQKVKPEGTGRRATERIERVESAALRTRFVYDCLVILYDEIKRKGKRSPHACELTLKRVNDRIRAVEKAHEEASRKGLPRNLLALHSQRSRRRLA